LSGPHLYRFPELYRALREPWEALVEIVDELLCVGLGGMPSRLLDPACGPGAWLELYARRGVQVAGSDLSPEMVAAARAALAGYDAEVVQGDMRELSFRGAPFDAAVEVSGVISELPDDSSLAGLIRSVMGQLRPGGVFVMAIECVEDGNLDLTHFETDEIGPIPLSDGSVARLNYDLERHDPTDRALHMRRRVSVTGGTRELEFDDHYVLRTYSSDDVRGIVGQVEGARLVSARHPTGYAELDPAGRWCNGEVLLLLRRVDRA
jgi:SAM-dependent methyltransferase